MSENAPTVYKAAIFYVVTIYFPALPYSSGTGVHQSFTHHHWSLCPLLLNNVTADVGEIMLLNFCLRKPHRCSIGFKSGDMLGHTWVKNILYAPVSICACFYFLFFLRSCEFNSVWKFNARKYQYIISLLIVCIYKSLCYHFYACHKMIHFGIVPRMDLMKLC